MRIEHFYPFLVVVTTLGAAPSCREPERSEPQQQVDAAQQLPQPFSIDGKAQNLLLSVLDEHGQQITADKIEGIPENLRSRVMVVDLSKSPEQRRADKYVFFADLSRPDAKGGYVARPMSRYRKPQIKPAGANLAPVAEGTVVIYMAPWCGFCKKAKAYFQQKKVPYVERNVEGSAAAARELQQKAKAAGVQASGVPVIDIDGTLVMGFDKAQINELLAKRGAKPAAH